MYRLKVFPTGQIDCDETILFRDGEPDKTRRINCLCYLLEKDGRVVLIDTGIADIDAVNRTKKGKNFWKREGTDGDLTAHLKKWGYTCDRVTDIILTHAHYDHIGGVPLLSNARVYLHRREWEALFSKDNPMKNELERVRSFLEERKAKGFVTLTEDGDTVLGDISLYLAGGHSAGSQLIKAATQLGQTLFTGDAVFLRENIERGRPIGFSHSPEESARIIGVCRAIPGVYMTGHDLLCMENIEGVNEHE